MKDIAVFGAGSYGEEIACLIKKSIIDWQSPSGTSSDSLMTMRLYGVKIRVMARY